jgi:hypothetical protein
MLSLQRAELEGHIPHQLDADAAAAQPSPIADPPQLQTAAARGEGSLHPEAAELANLQLEGVPPPRARTLTRPPGPWVGLLRAPGSESGGGGPLLLYKLAFVDLDLKPAAKAPKHAQLEAQLEALGSQHEAQLAQLARRAGCEPEQAGAA